MIFNVKEMDEAFEALSFYYDKILYVDVNRNTFKPIKVSTYEMDTIREHPSFSNWIRKFAESNLLHPDDVEEFLEFTDISRLECLNGPTTTYYRKFIGGQYHDVFLELIPMGFGVLYLFVKDLTKMEG